jgi:hypothetical protein
MRGLVLVALVALTGCAGGQKPVPAGTEERSRVYQAELERSRAAERERQEAAERALTPTQRAQRELEAAKVTRENELLERAASASPDYTAAVRRAAVANVDGESAIPSAPGAPRRAAANPRTREAVISAEEARLSEAVEIRRRQRLAEQGRQQQGQRDQQAAANCIALGQQIEASMYSSRSLLNLEAAATGAQTRENCWVNYQRSR